MSGNPLLIAGLLAALAAFVVIVVLELRISKRRREAHQREQRIFEDVLDKLRRAVESQTFKAEDSEQEVARIKKEKRWTDNN